MLQLCAGKAHLNWGVAAGGALIAGVAAAPGLTASAAMYLVTGELKAAQAALPHASGEALATVLRVLSALTLARALLLQLLLGRSTPTREGVAESA